MVNMRVETVLKFNARIKKVITCISADIDLCRLMKMNMYILVKDFWLYSHLLVIQNKWRNINTYIRPLAHVHIMAC